MISILYDVGHTVPGISTWDGWESGPDSAGGVGLHMKKLKNLGTKTIHYIEFYFYPVNALDDAVSCSVSKKSETCLLFTGPLEPNGVCSDYGWEPVWYNPTIKKAILKKVVITYADKTQETIPGDKVEIAAKKGGCYVATCVYGSYDCPQVWTLRRYRDYTLAESWYGRAFIRVYYAISPTLVKWFGNTKWFKKMWQGKLDRMVAKLQADGVESTPYEDKNW